VTQNEAEFDEIEPVSKSQLKRDSLELQALGRQLAALPAEHLARIPLDPPLIEAIELAKRLRNKRSALKRHYQFLGKLLRARDPEPIRAALAEIDQQGRASIRRHHRAENWRDRIVEEGNDAIDALLVEAPAADRQRLRQLWRNYGSAASDAKRSQNSRLIYKEIFEALRDEP
jgi:ribosome-associated protein